MAGTLLGLPNQLIDARTAGVYRTFKVNGVPALSILAARMLAAGFHGLVVSAVIALTAGPLFGATVPESWVALALLTVLSAFAFGATAALIGVVSNSTQSSVLLSQIVFLPSMLIGGLMIDLAALPEGVGAVARLLPTSNAVQAFIGHAYQGATLIDPTLAVAVLAGGGLVALALAIGLFTWDPDSQTRRLHPALALLVIAPYLVGLLVAIAWDRALGRDREEDAVAAVRESHGQCGFWAHPPGDRDRAQEPQVGARAPPGRRSARAPPRRSRLHPKG